MTNSRGDESLPFIISDSARLTELDVDSSTGFRVSSSRAEQEDVLWHYDDGKLLYGKNADDKNSPYIGALNEWAAQYLSGTLDINYQPTTLINTCKGWQIASLVVDPFLTTLSSVEDLVLLHISEEDKINSFVLNIFLANTDSNSGSILVHENKKDISQIDFERCFGYNGSQYDKNITNSLGTISTGPFFEEVKKMPIEKIINLPILVKIKMLKLDNFSTFLESIINNLSTHWPNSRNELLDIKKHVYNCIEYRKNNIEKLIGEQIIK